jgi:predicted glutamine amidotransferase
LPTLDAHLGEALELVKGDTDSERFFALITREISAREGDVEQGIAAACTWVAANLPLLAINFVLVTDDGLWALRYPQTHELYVLQREPGGKLRQTSSLGSRVDSAHGDSKALVVIASEKMDEDPEWRLLDSGELLHVSATLQVSSKSVLEGPPAKLLSLADLSAKARASQTKVL